MLLYAQPDDVCSSCRSCGVQRVSLCAGACNSIPGPPCSEIQSQTDSRTHTQTRIQVPLCLAFRYGTNSTQVLAAVRQLATPAPSGVSLLDKAQVVVNAVKVLKILDEIQDMLKVRRLAASPYLMLFRCECVSRRRGAGGKGGGRGAGEQGTAGGGQEGGERACV